MAAGRSVSRGGHPAGGHHAAGAPPRAVAHAGRTRVGGRRPLPAPRGAVGAGTVEGGCLTCSVPRLDVRRRGSLRACALGHRRRAPPPRAHLAPYDCDRALRARLGVPRRARRRMPPHRPGGRPDVPADQHAGRDVAVLGDADGRQLPRHHPLPVRPHRHVRAGAGHARAEVRDCRHSTTAARVPLRGGGEQHRPVRWPAGRRRRWCSGR